jgi:DNA-binding response OmpR family regulator
MTQHRQFLVIDDNADSRFLLVKTLLRKFPQALLQECQDSDVALSAARNPKLDTIVAHRAADVDGTTLIRMLRKTNPTVPIVMVSGLDRSSAAAEAGATVFLNYDEWLRIGTVVGDLLSAENAANAPHR